MTMATMAVCPICGRPVAQARRGRPRVYCCQAHRQAALRRRWPLGTRHLRDLGLDPELARVSPLDELRRAGVDC